MVIHTCECLYVYIYIYIYIHNSKERKVVSFHTEGDNQFAKIIIFSDLLIVLTGHVAL